MSILWIFHAEVRSGDGWKIPPELPPIHADKGCAIGGEFGWMKEHWISDRLFFGADALFPFARGRPPGASEFCRLWDEYWPGWDSDADKAAHWIDYERLYVDLWDEQTVLVASYAPVRLAGLFGDGTCAFPDDATRAKGRRLLADIDRLVTAQLRRQLPRASAARRHMRPAGHRMARIGRWHLISRQKAPLTSAIGWRTLRRSPARYPRGIHLR